MAAEKKHRDEQELERYGVWVKAGPDALDEHDTTSLELMDIEDSDNDELLITEEEEKLLGELEESSLPDFSDFEDSFNGPFDESIDDSFDSDLDIGSSETVFDVPRADSGLQDGESRELLHKIEDDLSALREEIRQLKEELTGLRVPAVAPSAADAAESGGFFEEEDDETIALTGDELDNILDSADMTEQSAKTDESPEEIDIEDIDYDISIDDEDSIDLSDDFTELSVDDLDEFDVAEPDDEDPALSILGSPDEPETGGEPDTIEIDIPGLDETIDLDDLEDIEAMHEEDVVNIDDIEAESIDIDNFEEITDLDDFNLDEDESIEISLENEREEPILSLAEDEPVLTESYEDESFDEGEEVELDLGEIEDNLMSIDESDMNNVEMEEISINDFGIYDSDEDESDVLAIGDIDDDEEINLSSLDIQEDEAVEDFEEAELDAVLAESIEDESDVDNPERPAEGAELEILEEAGPDDFENLEIEEIDLGGSLEAPDVQESADIEDLDLELDDLEEISLDEDLEEVILEEIGSLEEEELENEIPGIPTEDSIDDADLIEDLEIEIEDDDDIKVTLPDDDFNELPGTEEVDLDSLEALAAAPDMTEEPYEDLVELPELDAEELDEIDLDESFEELVEEDSDAEIVEIEDDDLDVEPEEIVDFEDFEDEKIPDSTEPTPQEFANQARTALAIGSLPGDLQNEIKEVLKYMDQLLESLPDDKIQEFARSEHFEVYKKIFEELGISD